MVLYEIVFVLGFRMRLDIGCADWWELCIKAYVSGQFTEKWSACGRGK
jgi:hypothetical protein